MAYPQTCRTLGKRKKINKEKEEYHVEEGPVANPGAVQPLYLIHLCSEEFVKFWLF